MAAFTYIDLFAGVSGLGLGLEIAVPSARCVCHVEVEVHAASVLAARAEEGSLADAPVWSDVRTFDGRPWHGVVDCLIGGFPCTDLSVAGKQAGIHGEHSGLWFEYLRIVREIEPGWVFIENVPAVIADPAGGIVLGGLAQSGYDAVWLSLRASDVGASHGRLRVFILAYKPGVRWGEGRPESAGISGRFDAPERHGAMADTARHERPGPHGQAGPRRGVCETGDELDDSAGARFSGRRPGASRAIRDGARRGEPGRRCNAVDDAELPERRAVSLRGSGQREGLDAGRQAASGAGVAESLLADTEHAERRAEHEIDGNAYGRSGPGRIGAELADSGCECDQRRREPGIVAGAGGSTEADGEERQRRGNAACDSLPLFAPGPGAAEQWAELLVRHPELRPAISQAEIEQLVHHLDDGLAAVLDGSRTDQLRACGNGVVALQGAIAFRILAERAALI